MQNGTEVLRRQRRIAQRTQKKALKRAKDFQLGLDRQEATRQSIVNNQKHAALQKVDDAIALAIERLDSNDADGWNRLGTLTQVCQVSGPHSDFWCVFHRKNVVLVQIPSIVRRGRVLEYYYGWRGKKMYFYIGADGHVYRDGWYKIYRAELYKRRKPSGIKRVARQINQICT